MKNKFLLLLAALLVIAALIYGYKSLSGEKEADEEGDQPITAASRVEQGAGGKSRLRLAPNTQELIGLHTITLTESTQPQEIKAYGRVLDPAPLVDGLSDVASARTSLETSSKEYQRLKSLFENGRNTSAKALEVAEAARHSNQIALHALESKLLVAWGKPVVSMPDPQTFVQSLVQLQTVLVRLDLPVGEASPESLAGARLMAPGADQSIPARFLGPATTTDPQEQGRGYLFLATNTVTRLTPGLAVTGFLELPRPPAHGVVVPDAAIVRSSERTWIYAQTSETTFARHEITLTEPVDGGWFVTNGITAGEKLVVGGAQALLSEERKNQIKLED